MSASILWTPIKPTQGHHLGVWAPSSFIKSLEDTVGFPCELGEGALATLRGMAAVFRPAETQKNPYQELIDAIEKYGAVSVWAEY